MRIDILPVDGAWALVDESRVLVVVLAGLRGLCWGLAAGCGGLVGWLVGWLVGLGWRCQRFQCQLS